MLKKKQQHQRLEENSKKIINATLANHKNHIGRLEDKLQLLDPVNMLKRGYSITSADGKVVRNAKTLIKGQTIETIFHDGIIESIVR